EGLLLGGEAFVEGQPVLELVGRRVLDRHDCRCYPRLMSRRETRTAEPVARPGGRCGRPSAVAFACVPPLLPVTTGEPAVTARASGAAPPASRGTGPGAASAGRP